MSTIAESLLSSKTNLGHSPPCLLSSFSHVFLSQVMMVQSTKPTALQSIYGALEDVGVVPGETLGRAFSRRSTTELLLLARVLGISVPTTSSADPTEAHYVISETITTELVTTGVAVTNATGGAQVRGMDDAAAEQDPIAESPIAEDTHVSEVLTAAVLTAKADHETAQRLVEQYALKAGPSAGEARVMSILVANATTAALRVTTLRATQHAETTTATPPEAGVQGDAFSPLQHRDYAEVQATKRRSQLQEPLPWTTPANQRLTMADLAGTEDTPSTPRRHATKAAATGDIDDRSAAVEGLAIPARNGDFPHDWTMPTNSSDMVRAIEHFVAVSDTSVLLEDPDEGTLQTLLASPTLRRRLSIEVSMVVIDDLIRHSDGHGPLPDAVRISRAFAAANREAAKLDHKAFAFLALAAAPLPPGSVSLAIRAIEEQANSGRRVLKLFNDLKQLIPTNNLLARALAAEAQVKASSLDKTAWRVIERDGISLATVLAAWGYHYDEMENSLSRFGRQTSMQKDQRMVDWITAGARGPASEISRLHATQPLLLQLQVDAANTSDSGGLGSELGPTKLEKRLKAITDAADETLPLDSDRHRNIPGLRSAQPPGSNDTSQVQALTDQVRTLQAAADTGRTLNRAKSAQAKPAAAAATAAATGRRDDHHLDAAERAIIMQLNRCFYCGDTQHRADTCACAPNERLCPYCLATGHVGADCTKLKAAVAAGAAAHLNA
jgi:hypothetical protein